MTLAFEGDESQVYQEYGVAKGQILNDFIYMRHLNSQNFLVVKFIETKSEQCGSQGMGGVGYRELLFDGLWWVSVWDGL